MAVENNERERNAQVNAKKYLDLYGFSAPSVVAFFVVFCILLAVTPMLKEHTLVTGLFTAVIVVMSIVRVAAARRVVAAYQDNPLFWNRFLLVTSLVSGLLWGGLNVLVIGWYGVTSAYSVYAMVMTCGLVGGCVISLAPELKLLMGYVACLLVPTIFWAALNAEWAIGVVFLVYILGMMGVGKKTNASYRLNMENSVLLEERAADISMLVHELREKAGELTGTSEGLRDISEEMVGASEETTTEIGGVESDASSMRENTAAISAAVEQASHNMEVTSASMEEMSRAVTEIAGQSARAMEISSQGVSRSEEASGEIKRLDEAAREIGKITEVITEISEQTNLLALNATIEAARAGEAGKGFAVVANEIKALAHQTAEATSGIRGQVKGIQDATTDSTRQIAAISEVIGDISTIVNGVAAAIEEQSASTREIDLNVGEMSAGMTDITAKAAESNQASETILVRIERAATQTRGNLENSRRVMDSAREVLDMADALNQAVGRLSA
ncbi:methyl-accepting chemotaxis protein [Desulfoluna spongiiphila]|uniref:Methyl-accepting chemotaxis protein n=1 Tax=Desulfoluna spongiiphila TaxID=419481 RepID=A0A1G5FXI9_9BACT|nr:methyl-accepting chemotaxis protein [Desulfoluna spongiiphila]SCY44065.1 Methyl-accepting chemotaxis protein [Desulfoluna spongiiphila]VVS91403.1 chemotaxis methyl-accepting receptor [Desulfoluna spongiiphila]